MQPDHLPRSAPQDERFRVDLRGVVEILSQHLYSSPRVFIRELLQNARDALAARHQLEHQQRVPTGGEPRGIRVRVDGPDIVVEDDGVGLTADEMRTLLATIGASSKRDDLARMREDFLGRFGIGLLSCFLIADTVDVLSRSVRTPDAPTMRWVGRSDGTYTITQSEVTLPAPGSRVRVRPRAEESMWAAVSRITRLARDFARYLDVPVDVLDEYGRPTRVSMHAWPENLPPDAARALSRDRFGFDPLSSVRINVPVLGIHGIAFLSPREDATALRAGDVVYSRGMLVADDNTQLAPPWAYFARLVIDSGSLALTASRESLQETSLLRDATQHVGAALREHIELMAQHQPETFYRFVSAHNVGLRAMALDDDTMFRFVYDHVPLSTSQGDRTLRELVDSEDAQSFGARTIFTSYSPTQFRALAPLARIQGRTLVNASHVHEPQLLQRLAALRDDVRITTMDLQTLVDGAAPASDSAGASAIESAVRAALPGFDVAVVDFGTDSLPALELPADDGWDPDGTEPAPSSSGWGSVFADMFEDTQPRGPRLVLNIASPLVQALGGALDPVVRTHAARALHVLGLLHAGASLAESDHALLGQSLGVLVSAATRPA